MLSGEGSRAYGESDPLGDYVGGRINSRDLLEGIGGLGKSTAVEPIRGRQTRLWGQLTQPMPREVHEVDWGGLSSGS